MKGAFQVIDRSTSSKWKKYLQEAEGFSTINTKSISNKWKDYLKEAVGVSQVNGRRVSSGYLNGG